MRSHLTPLPFAFAALSVFAVVGAQGQSASTQASQSTQASSTTPAPDQQVAQTTVAPTDSAAPTKRVWTNDDVHELRRDSAISTVGPAKAKPQKAAATNMPVANPATIKSYHDRILALQDKMPPLDSQISDLQGVLNGQTMNSTRHATGARIDDWHDQLARLQTQKSDLETKISTLQDEARHKGVPENQIPQ